MSQRPLFLDNLYSVKRQQRKKRFINGCRIVFITGAIAIIIIPFIMIGTRDTIHRARKYVHKSAKMEIKNIQNKTISYHFENQK